MADKRMTRLVFRGVSEIVGSSDLGVLLLTDEEEKRQLTIVCDKSMALQIEMRLSHASTTDMLLPEVLCRMMLKIADAHMMLIINGIDDGQYRVLLTSSLQWVEPQMIRASDAVLLSLIAGVPIFIDNELMKRQSVTFSKNAHGIAMPVNSISDEMLSKAMKKAIEEENYELASHLRDEIRRRKKGCP